MLNQWISSCVCAALLAVAAWPASSFADKQDHDLADRVYEKFKEREQKDRGEQQKRTSGQKQQRASGQQKKYLAPPREDAAKTTRAKSERSSNSNKSYDRARNDKSYVRAAPKRSQTSGQASSTTTSSTASSATSSQTRSQTRSDERTRAPVQRSFNDSSRNNRSSAPAREEQVVERVSLDQAVNIIRRRTPGKVVGAKTTGSGSRRQHRIKVLIDDSRVRTYIVNASTGDVY